MSHFLGRVAVCMAIVFGVASTEATASDAAWVFAHRANTSDAIGFAAKDSGVNAIEIDVSLRSRLGSGLRGDCDPELWCAHHSGDANAPGLSEVLKAATSHRSLGAVWLDIKTTDATETEYEDLVRTVNAALGVGGNTMRRFWGVWPATGLNSVYVANVYDAFADMGGNRQNVFIVELDAASDLDIAARWCAARNLQCGVSAGNPFLGDLGTSSGPSWDMQNMSLISSAIAKTSINSVFMWTFNWAGPYEDDMTRLLFNDREEWEYLAGVEWQCGQEGNGAIYGAVNSIYYGGFCNSVDGDEDACSTAAAAIRAGPNSAGHRGSNIGIPRNKYKTSRNNC